MDNTENKVSDPGPNLGSAPQNEPDSPEIGATPYKGPQNEGSSKGWEESKGRFARLPKEEITAIAAKGGSTPSTGKGKAYTKCIKCEIRGSCKRAYEESKKHKWSDDESRCVYEMEGRQQIRDMDLREYKAFVSANPVDLLEKIQTTFKKLEEEVKKDVSYTKLTNLLYLLMNIYRLKFGEKAFVMNVHKDVGSNASMDIKEMVKEMRSQQNKDDAIDIDPHQVSKNAEQK